MHTGIAQDTVCLGPSSGLPWWIIISLETAWAQEYLKAPSDSAVQPRLGATVPNHPQPWKGRRWSMLKNLMNSWRFCELFTYQTGNRETVLPTLRVAAISGTLRGSSMRTMYDLLGREQTLQGKNSSSLHGCAYCVSPLAPACTCQGAQQECMCWPQDDSP